MSNTQKDCQKRMQKSLRMMTFILILLLLSTNAYARPITDVFSSSLVRISSFFDNREYEPYATAIDFFLFSILFIAVYMAGARYAFKEIKKPEQVIVILLGLITAFLLVLADFSITLLLPYMNWMVYILLFLLFLWLLKGVPSKIWRILIALLALLLLIALLQGLFSFSRSLRFCDLKYFNWLIFILTFLIWLFVFRKAIKNVFWRLVAALLLALLIVVVIQKICGYAALPEVAGIEAPSLPAPELSASYPEGIGGFFSYFADSVKGFFGNAWSYVKDFFGNFKGINFGGFQPGVPDWLRGDSLRQVPGQQFATDSRTLQPVFGSEPPAAAPSEQKPSGAAPSTAETAESEWHWYNPFSWGGKEETPPTPTAQPPSTSAPTPTTPTGQQPTTQRPSGQPTAPVTTPTTGRKEQLVKAILIAVIVMWLITGLLAYRLAKKRGLKAIMPKFGAKRLLAFGERWRKPSAIAEKSRVELNELYNSIGASLDKKEELLRDANVKETYLKRIAEKDAPELYFDRNRKLINKTEGKLRDLLHAERDLLEALQKLRDKQVALFKRLPEFKNTLQNLPDNAERRKGESILEALRASIDHREKKAA